MSMIPVRCQLLSVGLIACALLLNACGPSKANVQLRKENQQLQQRVWDLERLRQGDLQRIAAIEGSSTRPALPYSEVQKLYTAHGLDFGKLTGGYKQNDRDERYSGVAVYVVPTDQDGDKLKAAGSFAISVFDLAVPEKPLVGQRVFSVDEAKAAWNGKVMLFHYVLRVPFGTQVQHPDLLVRVEFTDELTGRRIVGERKVSLTR